MIYSLHVAYLLRKNASRLNGFELRNHLIWIRCSYRNSCSESLKRNWTSLPK